MSEYNSRARCCAFVVCTVAAVTLVLALTKIASWRIPTFYLLILAAALAERMEVDIGRQASHSLGSTVSFAVAIMLPWPETFVVSILGVAIASSFSRKPLVKACYNASQVALCAAAASAIFRWSSLSHADLLTTSGLMSSIIAWIAFFSLNSSLVAGFISLRDSISFWGVLSDIVIGTYPVAPLGGALGICLVILFTSGGVAVGITSVAVLLVTYRAYLAGVFKARNDLLLEQYADSQVYLNELMASMMNAVVGIDLSHRVNIFNRGAEQLFGCQASSILGQDVAEVSELTLPVLLIQCLRTGESLSDRELELRTADKTVDVLCNITIMKNVKGKTTGSVAVLQDITERKRLEQRLNHLDRLSLLGEFAAGIVHEINNPLTLIQMAVDGVESELARRRETDEVAQLQIASRNLVRLQKLAQQLLSFSRPRPAEPKPLNVSEVLNDVLGLATVQARVARVRLDGDIPEGITILGEAAPLQQVFLNLVVNAVQAMPNGGVLQVTLGQRRCSNRDVFAGDGNTDGLPRLVRDLSPVGAGEAEAREMVWIRFADTGTGIPAEVMERLGQSFVTTKATGTGLGMAMVSKVLAQYQGLLEIVSQPGQGSAITIWLPKLSAEALTVTTAGGLSSADARLSFKLTPPDEKKRDDGTEQSATALLEVAAISEP